MLSSSSLPKQLNTDFRGRICPKLLSFVFLQTEFLFYCLIVRAYKKIVELRQLLEIAESNYKQLGGITEDDIKKRKEEQQFEK